MEIICRGEEMEGVFESWIHYTSKGSELVPRVWLSLRFLRGWRINTKTCIIVYLSYLSSGFKYKAFEVGYSCVLFAGLASDVFVYACSDDFYQFSYQYSVDGSLSYCFECIFINYLGIILVCTLCLKYSRLTCLQFHVSLQTSQNIFPFYFLTA